MNAAEVIAYAFNAALHCEACTLARYPDPDTAEDSEGNGVSPVFADEESDCPRHCDDCGIFLENSLTADGVDYVVEAIIDDLAAGRTDSVAVTTWAPYYDVPVEPVRPADRWDLCQGAYLALAHYHGWQGSRAYRRLSILTRFFRPSPMLSIRSLSTEALAWYVAIAVDAIRRG